MSPDEEHESAEAPRDDDPVDLDRPRDPADATTAPPGPRRAPIRRRWSIFGGAGTGVVILATVGTIALGTPQDRSDGSQVGSGADGGELAVDGPGGSSQDQPD